MFPSFPPPTRSVLCAGGLFCFVFLVHSLCPITTVSDSRWTVPVALSLLDHGDTNIDEYPALMEQEHYYSVECVEADGTLRTNQVCHSGHYYNWYPVAVPVLVSPIVFGLRKIVSLLAPWLAKSPIPAGRPVLSAFLTGDFVGGRAVVELLIASFLVTVTTAIVFFIGRLFLPDSYSVFLALIFAFATSAWSTASRALWQHGPSMLMLSIALYLLLLADTKPWLVPFAAVPVTLAYLLRPTNSLFVAAVTLYVARNYRRYLWSYLLTALPLAAAFVIYNESIYRRALQSYFSLRPQLPHLPGDAIPMFQALAGSLVSPSRGLLIYTPVFLFSIWGMVWAYRTGWRTPLTTYLTAVILGHWLLMGVYFALWWSGHSYGPRLFTDLTPLFILFLIPGLIKWRESVKWPMRPAAVTFAVLLAVSVFIHSRGALSADVYLWNASPVNVDQNPARVWDWSDPQFLRGLLR